ncbi:MAG: DNA polymerase/3'-5' exonuclease PolX, partial [Candidatus Bathyarchaeia archaeon]
PTTEENVLEHIELAKRGKERMLLGFALPIAEEIKKRLKKETNVDIIEVAGSLRRMKETIGDVDILVTTKHPNKVADYFTSMDNVYKILGKGETRCSVLMKSGMQVDLRIVAEKSYGSALLYFTGCKDHNIKLRKVAINKGYKLNEYGLFKREEQIRGKIEEEIFKELGMDFIPPELRENRGEIEAAQTHNLPELIGYDDIKGDLQMHTKWSDGGQTIEEMAKTAKDLGYSYICVSDHYSKMKIAGGLNEKQLRKQLKEIDQLNNQLKEIKVLKGAEVDIAADGSLEANGKVLKELDLVVASVHSKFNQPKRKMTKRLISAMETAYVNIIGHPTCRKINKKKPVQIDMEEFFETAKRTETYLEINSFPERLDLDDINAKAASEAGCKLVINTDAHDREHLRYMRLGVGVARRGWIQREDVINTLSLKGLMRLLESK